MFNDGDWVYNPIQHEQFEKWSKTVKSPLVIEIGAGKSISSIREISEDYKKQYNVNVKFLFPDHVKSEQLRHITRAVIRICIYSTENYDHCYSRGVVTGKSDNWDKYYYF